MKPSDEAVKAADQLEQYIQALEANQAIRNELAAVKAENEQLKKDLASAYSDDPTSAPRLEPKIVARYKLVPIEDTAPAPQDDGGK